MGWHDDWGARTVVHVVQIAMRILGIVYYERSTQAITVLKSLVTVVPKCA